MTSVFSKRRGIHRLAGVLGLATIGAAMLTVAVPPSPAQAKNVKEV